LQIYVIRQDYDGYHIRPNLSPSPETRMDWDSEGWSLFRALKPGLLGGLPARAVARLQLQTVHIQNTDQRPFHALGAHGMAPDDVMLVSDRMRQALTALDPRAFAFVPMSRLMDHTAGRLTDDAGLHFVHARLTVDAVDEAEAPLKKLRSVSPGWHRFKFKGRYALRARKLPKAHYFRCRRTGLGFCTQEFRDTVDALGHHGWSFFTCRLTDR
jgi:hypothetical protein